MSFSSQKEQKSHHNVPKPSPAYYPLENSPLYANKSLYSSISNSKKSITNTYVCQPRSGISFKVPAKSVFRIKTPDGPQVCDLNIWNQHNPRERLWVARTRQLHSAHVSTYDRLWSNLPYLRPLATITGDSLNARHDEWGGRVHDTLGTRCDPYVDKLLSGEDNDLHCHSNLTRAILPHGLTEFDVHDVLNVFQVTGLTPQDQYFMSPCPATKDDYFELFAEQDLLVAISACPGGDLSQWGWGEDSDNLESSKMVDCCRKLTVEVYDVEEEALKEWKSPEVVDYRGRHGLRGP